MGKLSFVGCRRGLGKSHHGSPPCVQLSLDLFLFRPTGLKPWLLVPPGALASEVIEGMEVASFPWGQGSYPRKKCQLQRPQEKLIPLSP